ncbi:MAG: TrkA C-terminal domain-containing protein, partial [Flavobacteriaceae bacterium]|nr:TrkA C-terminal domain-containing protein [Flavobacteriaceae bacterium]
IYNLAKYWLFVIFDTSEESHLIIFFLKTKIRDSQTLLFSNFRIAVIPNKEIVTLSVKQGSNSVVEKTIQESGISKNYGVTVLAIKRNKHYLTEISPETVIKQGDLLYLFGNPTNINNLNKILSL